MDAVEKFHDKDVLYWTWVEHHERGFVLNVRLHEPMIHTARCMHLYAPNSYKQATKTPKWCSVNRSALEDATRKANLTIKGCQTCKT